MTDKQPTMRERWAAKNAARRREIINTVESGLSPREAATRFKISVQRVYAVLRRGV